MVDISGFFIWFPNSNSRLIVLKASNWTILTISALSKTVGSAKIFLLQQRQIRVFESIFKQKKSVHTRTFTYYIPAPPSRKSGYHEKEFDIISHHLIQQGFEILDVKMEAHSSAEGGGVWIVCLLGTTDHAIASQKIEVDFIDIANQQPAGSVPVDPDIIHEI